MQTDTILNGDHTSNILIIKKYVYKIPLFLHELVSDVSGVFTSVNVSGVQLWMGDAAPVQESSSFLMIYLNIFANFPIYDFKTDWWYKTDPNVTIALCCLFKNGMV